MSVLLFLCGASCPLEPAELLRHGIWGNADSIAESDFTWIFIHGFVIIFLK